MTTKDLDQRTLILEKYFTAERSALSKQSTNKTLKNSLEVFNRVKFEVSALKVTT